MDFRNVIFRSLLAKVHHLAPRSAVFRADSYLPEELDGSALAAADARDVGVGAVFERLVQGTAAHSEETQPAGDADSTRPASDLENPAVECPDIRLLLVAEQPHDGQVRHVLVRRVEGPGEQEGDRSPACPPDAKKMGIDQHDSIRLRSEEHTSELQP